MKVEKCYKFHRERILNVSAGIDDQLVAPDSLTEQGFKRRHAHNIALENVQYYNRLDKADKKVSAITKDNMEHFKITNDVKCHISTISGKVRVKKMTQIQNENKYFLHRLQSAKPGMSKESLQEWYQGHANIREGR